MAALYTYITLMFEFFKVGLFSVGGGLATLPFLYNLADRFDWFDRAALANMIAVSESTPGPMGVNMATYAGYHAGGLLGGVLATLALAFPELVIIIVISKFLSKFSENKYVKGVFYALHPAVGALITLACIQVYKSSFLSSEGASINIAPFLTNGIYILPLHFIIFAIIFAVKIILKEKFNKKIHPIAVIAIGAVLGAALSL